MHWKKTYQTEEEIAQQRTIMVASGKSTHWFMLGPVPEEEDAFVVILGLPDGRRFYVTCQDIMDDYDGASAVVNAVSPSVGVDAQELLHPPRPPRIVYSDLGIGRVHRSRRRAPAVYLST